MLLDINSKHFRALLCECYRVQRTNLSVFYVFSHWLFWLLCKHMSCEGIRLSLSSAISPGPFCIIPYLSTRCPYTFLTPSSYQIHFHLYLPCRHLVSLTWICSPISPPAPHSLINHSQYLPAISLFSRHWLCCNTWGFSLFCTSLSPLSSVLLTVSWKNNLSVRSWRGMTTSHFFGSCDVKRTAGIYTNHAASNSALFVFISSISYLRWACRCWKYACGGEHPPTTITVNFPLMHECF